MPPLQKFDSLTYNRVPFEKYKDMTPRVAAIPAKSHFIPGQILGAQTPGNINDAPRGVGYIANQRLGR